MRPVTIRRRRHRSRSVQGERGTRTAFRRTRRPFDVALVSWAPRHTAEQLQRPGRRRRTMPVIRQNVLLRGPLWNTWSCGPMRELVVEEGIVVDLPCSVRSSPSSRRISPPIQRLRGSTERVAPGEAPPVRRRPPRRRSSDFGTGREPIRPPNCGMGPRRGANRLRRYGADGGQAVGRRGPSCAPSGSCSALPACRRRESSPNRFGCTGNPRKGAISSGRNIVRRNGLLVLWNGPARRVLHRQQRRGSFLSQTISSRPACSNSTRHPVRHTGRVDLQQFIEAVQ